MDMPENILQKISFKSFWTLGYKGIIPIVPHNAEISAKSSLTRSTNSPLGKAPGRKNRDGKWAGFDWISHKTTEEDLVDWQDMGAGVGIKTGLQDGSDYSLIAIDADILDEANAKIALDMIKDQLGPSPIRVGQHPKALYLFRLKGTYRYSRIDFGDKSEHGDYKERVEILTDKRQFVAQGLHAKTLKPYVWHRELLPFTELVEVTENQLNALLESLRGPLKAQERVQTKASASVSQAALRGDPTMVREALALIPNTSDNFGTREQWLELGYAVKASLPDEFEAYQLWEEFCDRWVNAEGRFNKPDRVESEWRRMIPPYRVGATYIFNKANKITRGAFNDTPHYYQAMPEIEVVKTPFDDQPAFQQTARKRVELFSIQDVLALPPPEWRIDRYLPERGLGFIYGHPGTFKSFLALDMGMHMAYRLPKYHGYNIKPREGTVIYIAAEGFRGQSPRIQAWQQHNGVEGNALLEFVPSSLNFMDAGLIGELIDAIKAKCTTTILIIVDTVSRAIPGAEENQQGPMTLFVAACDRLRDTFDCLVMGLHHSDKAGVGLRGSGVLAGAGDFVFRVEKPKGERRVSVICEKQKDGEGDWKDEYQMLHVGASLVPVRLSEAEIEATGEHQQADVLALIQARWEASEPLSKSNNTGSRYAPGELVKRFGMTRQHWIDTLKDWEAWGLIVYQARVDNKNTRRPAGYEVVSRTIEASVFD